MPERMSMDSMEKYYKMYYELHGDKAYALSENAWTSRVLTIRDWVKQRTPQGGKVLDVGCGDFGLSKVVPGYDWSGIDINPKEPNPKVMQHDLMLAPYPYQNASFDTAVCSEVLEHLWDLRLVHKEVHRILKPGGYYIVSTPNFDWLDHKLGDYRHLLFDDNMGHLFEHIRLYNRSVHEKFLNKAGFSVVDFTGADAQYSKYFQQARRVLLSLLNDKLKVNASIGNVDQIIGQMFPELNHTIMLLARKNA